MKFIILVTNLKGISPSVFLLKKNEYIKNCDAILLLKYDSAEKKILNYVLKNGVGRYNFLFYLCHVLSWSTNNFAHAQTLSQMSSLSGRMNIARVSIEFFTGFNKIKQRRISFVLCYFRMILWKISTAISIKHRILSTFNKTKNSILIACMPFRFWLVWRNAHICARKEIIRVELTTYDHFSEAVARRLKSQWTAY
jgi:hypothetical protein